MSIPRHGRPAQLPAPQPAAHLIIVDIQEGPYDTAQPVLLSEPIDLVGEAYDVVVIERGTYDQDVASQ